MAAAGSVRRVIRALTKQRAMQATTEAALLHGAHLLDVRAARLAAESFTQEIAALPEAEARFVFSYLAEDDTTQRQIWSRLHDSMAGRHNGPLH